MEPVAGAVIAGVLGVYAIRVAIAGNSRQLISLLAQEGGYLEFIASAYAVYLLHNQGGVVGTITDQLLWAAAIAALFNVMKANSNFVDELSRLATHQQGLKTTFQHIFAGAE